MAKDISAKKLSEVLFNDKAYRILGHLFDNPEEEFSITEIKENVDVSRPVISDVVDSLKDTGVIDKRKKGNLYLISVNENSAYYQPLDEILQLDSKPLEESAEKLLGELKSEKLLKRIVSVYLFGSVARGVPRTDSDIDLLFVHESGLSEDEKTSIENFTRSLEKKLKVTFSITWYEEGDLKNDRESGVAFAERVGEEGKHFYGDELW